MNYKTRKCWKRPKTGAKSVDRSCQNNGRDKNACKQRQIKNIKREQSVDDEILDAFMCWLADKECPYGDFSNDVAGREALFALFK